MAKCFSKKVRKQGMSFQLPCTCNPNKKFMSRCLSVPYDTSLNHCLKLNAFSGKDPARGEFNIMHT